MGKYSFNMNTRDQVNETRIMAEFVKFIGPSRFTAVKVKEAIDDTKPEFSGEYIEIPDFQILRNQSVIGYAEAKQRNLSFAALKRLGGIFLAQKKYAMLLEKVPEYRCVFVAGLKHGVFGYHSINDDRIVRTFMGGGGATNRNSPDDIELMVVFDPDQFKLLYPA